jgi:hypothetical protein
VDNFILKIIIIDFIYYIYYHQKLTEVSYMWSAITSIQKTVGKGWVANLPILHDAGDTD